jgi:Domain of unknown function (DUF5916)
MPTVARRCLAAALSLLVAASLMAQAPADCWTPRDPATADSGRIATAATLRSVQALPIHSAAPVIDGRVNEAIWCEAMPATDFVQSGPNPGNLGTLPTSARILFDAAAVYVAVRLFDPHPERIAARYPRRDDEVNSDWVFVELDTRFDRRSGFSFGLNPRGVQVDGTWWGDVNYDPAWNGVWQGAATIDSAGWTAEFRIPFSQLALTRRAPSQTLTWGFNVYRTTPHQGETSNWSPRLPTVIGVVSHFNHLEGIRVPPGARVEVTPYGAVTGIRAPRGLPDGMSQRIGADLRLRPTPSTSALLSLHPDFGQVEADPSQVNLTTFETFLAEQRPLFVEGAEIFQFAGGLNFGSRGTSFAQESPFYSRRVGRPPRASTPSGLKPSDAPHGTTVLGAGTFSARSASGWSGGLLHAWSNAELGTSIDSPGTRRSMQLEPLTSYSVARALRESRGGSAAVGLMVTAVDRVGLASRIDSQLPRDAYVIGSDARWRRGMHEVTGFVEGSRVSGSAPAIAALRAEPRHGYHARASSERGDRSLTGVATQARIARVEGALQWGLAGRAVSQGFEANDAGFQRNANWLLISADWQYLRFRPGRWLRRWSIGSSGVGLGWTMTGLRRAATANVTLSGSLRNYWGGSLTASREFAASDPEVLRGGPPLSLPGRDGASLQLYSDTRRAWQLSLNLRGEREPASGSHRLSIEPSATGFVTDRLQLGVTPEIGWVREGWQYVGRATGQAGDSSVGGRYLLGGLNQREASLTTRVTYAFSSHLTLQWYLQAFLSSGQYTGFSEVRSPQAARPSDRVAPIEARRLVRDPGSGIYLLDPGTDSAAWFSDPAFADRSLHHNLVLRWEFLPGSTLFLVWTQARSDRVLGPFRLGRDLRRLAHAAPTNALQLKVSYWIAAGPHPGTDPRVRRLDDLPRRPHYLPSPQPGTRTGNDGCGFVCDHRRASRVGLYQHRRLARGRRAARTPDQLR